MTAILFGNILSDLKAIDSTSGESDSDVKVSQKQIKNILQTRNFGYLNKNLCFHIWVGINKCSRVIK